MLIVLLSTALGASMYEHDRKKVKIFSLINAFIEELYTGIRYTGSTIEEMLIDCANNSTYADLTFLKRTEREIRDSGMMSDTVKKAVLNSLTEMNMTRDEMQPLITISEKLGTTDAEGQLKMLDICKIQVAEQRAQAFKRCDVFGKMYISLGFLLGLGTAVILA